MIQVQGLTKRYGKKEVFRDLNAHFEQGLVHGILGPNGCGKTTLIKAMLGLIHSQSGAVLLDGKSLAQQREKVSWLPQHPQAPGHISPRKLFSFIASLRGQEALYREELIAAFGFKAELDKPLSSLSGGNFQKCFLISTLMFPAPLIILDEPTVGLDPVAAAIFKRVLKERAQTSTILLISHITSEISQLSDKVHFLLGGRWVFQGCMEDIKNQPHFVSFEEFMVQILAAGGTK